MELKKLLNDILSNENINNIELNYDKYKTVPLSSLGVDSLHFMKLLINIEEEFLHAPIDYSSFSFEKIETLEKINKFIEDEVTT